MSLKRILLYAIILIVYGWIVGMFYEVDKTSYFIGFIGACLLSVADKISKNE